MSAAFATLNWSKITKLFLSLRPLAQALTAIWPWSSIGAAKSRSASKLTVCVTGSLIRPRRSLNCFSRRRLLSKRLSRRMLRYAQTGARIGAAEVHAFEAPPAPVAKRRFRPKRVERLEINVEQPSFDFHAAANHADKHDAKHGALDGSLEAAVSGYDSPAHSVAPLVERRRAGALDVAFLLGAYAAFLTLFCGFGGRFAFTRLDALVQLATLGLLYAQYVALFTYFAGATPGMTLRGLRVVSLDGLEPSPRQLLWRSFGYLVSAGTMMLGFVWALWDEDQLSWHDRISQTCITTDVAFASRALRSAQRNPMSSARIPSLRERIKRGWRAGFNL